jgi:hypothetical protein
LVKSDFVLFGKGCPRAAALFFIKEAGREKRELKIEN